MDQRNATALVPLEQALPARPVTTVDELVNALDRMKGAANLVSPVTRVDYIPSMHRVSMRVVQIDAAVDEKGNGTDTYRDGKFCGANERALTKVGLLRIWQAAGGSVVDSRRLDDGKDPLYCHWGVSVRIPQLDGRIVEFRASKEVDLRPGAPQANAMTEKQVAMARNVIQTNAETKALLRAIRGSLAIRQKYSTDDLRRPFVVPAIVPDLDTSDPEIRRMVAAKALGMETMLYGPTRAALNPPQETVPVIELAGDELEPEPAPGPADDFADPPPVAPEPSPPSALCGCPCGCGTELSDEVAAKTTEKVGAARCAACYPFGWRFEYDRHAHLPDLQLPNFPGMTPQKAREMTSRTRAAGGAR